jgi:hypothetical protein
MKLISIITAGFLSLSIITGRDDPKSDPDKYCAKVKDGKITVVHEENPITGTITLTNGTQIMTDGTLVTREGIKSELKEGECIDKDGKITKEIKIKVDEHENKK